ncbi:MAG: hypothetical protein M3279_04070 [Actinomycetota bacterium]|nr:hypothetical protein [Actinomycetota bacterium]
MDTDLFQILTLILLLGLLLTLFGVLQSLGAIRKSLDRGASAAAPAAAPEPVVQTPASEPDEQPSTWTRPEETAEPQPVEAEPARTGWPAPQVAAAPEPSTAVEEPAPADATGSRVLYGDTGLTAATPSDAALRPAEASEPAAQAAPEPETQTALEPERQGAAAEDPQEQPFERDGRWWFRRGDELLVYEEQTGQWVAAPEPSTSGSVAASSQPAGGTEAAAAPVEGQVTTQHEAVGSFWKCPSCGAVNGSTATSCRMCFTARP